MSLRTMMKLTYVSQEFVWNQLEVNLVISGVARGEETGTHLYCLREYKSVQFVQQNYKCACPWTQQNSTPRNGPIQYEVTNVLT